MFRDNIVIAVVRGGKGEFAPRSLSAGSAMISTLRDAATVLDIFVDIEGVWHMAGVPRRQGDIVDHADIVISVIPQASAFRDDIFHAGLFGHVPSIGTGTASGALLSRVPNLYAALDKRGVKTPPMKIYHNDGADGWTGLAEEILSDRRLPVVLRPALDEFPDEEPVAPISDSDGIFRVLHTYGANPYHEGIVAEEYIHGKRITVFVIDGFRGEASYIVPPVPTFNAEIATTPLSIAESRYAQETARMAYDALDIDGFARFDMVIGPSGAYVLGVYTVPDISSKSPIHRALTAVGSGEKELVIHLVNRALDARLR